jgi:malic enzyme
MKYRIERSPDGEWIAADVWKRGSAIITDSLLNKGTAFSPEERILFELEGMIPYRVTDRAHQRQRAYETITEKGHHPLDMYVSMAALQDRNETLYYQVLGDHVEELLPIVYTPTVGEAAVKYSHLFRRGRGLWITPAHQGRMFDVLAHARNEEVRLIVVTDNERILGLGDQGAGGMVIPIGKLALYTLGAGIHPAYTLPISLDVGTDNQRLLDDELYIGWRHPRLRGDAYYEFVDEFVDAVRRRFPEALLQWEDFKKANAFTLLDRYREVLPSFNDDIQGTAAVVVAGVLAYGRATGTKLADQRIVLVGSGAAGIGIARQIHHILESAGVAGDDLYRRIALMDTRGLVVKERDGLEDYKHQLAWPDRLATEVDLTGDAAADLPAVIEALQPTVLIGTTGQPGLFDEAVVKAAAHHVERPLVMALSNPTSKTEAIPAEVFARTDGRAFMATGSPFSPVDYEGRSIPVPQCNNVYVFPGVGLGAIVSKATRVTDAMFAAAADELASQASDADLADGRLYPPLADLRTITRRIASVVARAAVDGGVADAMTDAQIQAALDHEIWDFSYPTLRPI